MRVILWHRTLTPAPAIWRQSCVLQATQNDTQPPSREPSTFQTDSPMPQKCCKREFEVLANTSYACKPSGATGASTLNISCSTVLWEGPQGGNQGWPHRAAPVLLNNMRTPATRISPLTRDPSPRACEFQVGTWLLQPRSWPGLLTWTRRPGLPPWMSLPTSARPFSKGKPRRALSHAPAFLSLHLNWALVVYKTWCKARGEKKWKLKKHGQCQLPLLCLPSHSLTSPESKSNLNCLLLCIS